MFSLVKSLFFTTTTTSSDPEDEFENPAKSVKATSKNAVLPTQQPIDIDTSSEESDSGNESDNESESESPNGPSEDESEGPGRRASISASRDGSSIHDLYAEQSPVIEPSQDVDADEDDGRLLCSLYYVEGRDFECLIRRCEIHFEDPARAIVAHNLADLTKRPIEFNFEKLGLLRQHLPDGLQFMIKRGVGNAMTTEEYGVQFTTDFKAAQFRRKAYCGLLAYGGFVLDIQIQCAVAEYDSASKEFVIIGHALYAALYKRHSDGERLFVVKNGPEDIAGTKSSGYGGLDEAINSYINGNEPDNDIEKNTIFYIDCLTRDMQIWPSPDTNQISFWEIPFGETGNAKKMVLLEMAPSITGEVQIDSFFGALGQALGDKTFFRRPVPGIDMDEDTDMKFDFGATEDKGTRKAWTGAAYMTDDKPYDTPEASEDDQNHDHPRRRARQRRRSFNESCDTDDSDGTPYPQYACSSSARGGKVTHKFMEVGSARTFVCREGPDGRRQLKVYKKDRVDDEEVLQPVTVFQSNRFAYDGQEFTPGRGILHDSEQKFLVAPEYDTTGEIYLMDLEREKVVQKYTSNSAPVETLFHSKKYGGTTHDPTFLCTNTAAVFKMDTRTKGGQAGQFEYKTNPKISVGATDTSGHILLGSRLGELRLFDGDLNARGDFKRCKTLLQSIREPITAVDVTRDGSWILATTKTFLVVFCTKLAGTNRTGFETCLGQLKPQPRYLVLQAEDLIKYKITEINFAPAHFDPDEESIVTSTGNMAVVWDFGTVKRGKPFYSVRFAADDIKDVQIPASSSSVVVAYPTAVGLFGTETKMVSTDD